MIYHPMTTKGNMSKTNFNFHNQDEKENIRKNNKDII
jgi:hypothetical protein|tara:strand:- start:354 stop:464 length:111 start_codon:yes stop_codon:yes gene_type:complete